ncbi:MAG: type II toxin-antitoxin system CcdA family antitoxin [Desulfurococcaceae archaeon]|nr:type II toxin-antitoxin system CcdA family antitoxin [Desulfurococcaceae archaeon]
MGSYVTVSVKVRRDLVERARALGVNIAEVVRRAVEEEVKRRELELIRRRLEDVRDLLDLIDVDRVVKSVREDRESR